MNNKKMTKGERIIKWAEGNEVIYKKSAMKRLGYSPNVNSDKKVFRALLRRTARRNELTIVRIDKQLCFLS